MARDAARLLASMRTRRVVRSWTDRPLTPGEVLKVIRAARWAPAAGNRRVQRYVAVRDPRTIRLICSVSPGISSRPAALIVICLDRNRAARVGARSDALLYFDVGTAAENMLLAAHALGLGAGPVTSFSAEAVRVILDLPRWLSPAVMICLGHPAEGVPVRRVHSDRPAGLGEVVSWERFDGGPPDRAGEAPPDQASPRHSREEG